MRILHLLPHLSGGGAERQLSYLAPELVRSGHDVHIAYYHEGCQKPNLPGIVLHKINKISNYDPFIVWKLCQLIRRIKPDILQSWIMQIDILGGIAARICGVPWVFREASSAKAYSNKWKHRLRVQKIGRAHV